jgi:hypothetical protein
MVKIIILNHMEGCLITLLPLTTVISYYSPSIVGGTPTNTHDAYGLSIKYDSTPNPHIYPQQKWKYFNFLYTIWIISTKNPYFPFPGPP